MEISNLSDRVKSNSYKNAHKLGRRLTQHRISRKRWKTKRKSTKQKSQS